MADTSRDIRGVMIPITGGRVLLPNATIAEVVSYTNPEKIPNAPDWLLGRLPWRGWRLPLFSFAMLSGSTPQRTFAANGPEGEARPAGAHLRQVNSGSGRCCVVRPLAMLVQKFAGARCQTACGRMVHPRDAHFLLLETLRCRHRSPIATL